MRKAAFTVLTLTVLALFHVAFSLLQTHADKKTLARSTLYSNEQVLGDGGSTKDVAVRFSSTDQTLYVLGINRQVSIYDSQHRRVLSIPTQMGSPDSIAVDSEGGFYVADSVANQIRGFNSKGEITRTLQVFQPLSIAVLSNGELVVGSVRNGALIHVYDSFGKELRKFGNIHEFVVDSVSENYFLNRGKVLVDSFNTIYYVHLYAPVPTVQRFSKKGQLLSEFVVEGAAIDLQIELAQIFLKGRNPKVGGIGIINSAAIDPVTNDIWICMNGSSDSGVAYRYTSEGTKVQEYRFMAGAGSAQSKVITAVYHIAARTPSVCIFASSGAFSFDIDSGRKSAEFEILDAGCAVAVEFPNCKTTCGTEATSDDLDCKAALLETVNLNNHRIVESHCNIDSNSCSASIKLCKESNGVISDHSISLSCGSSGGGGDPCSRGEFSCDPGYCWDDSVCDCVYCGSPILIDILGNGFDLTSAAGGVAFDLNNNGERENISWTAAGSDDAFLVLDRNGNGTIDDGTELFGNFTPQPPSNEPNGFIALAEYDKPANGGNADGQIDYRDAIFSSLRLWQDVNHNGVSEANELHTLPSLGLAAIDLNFHRSKRMDQYGNWFRYRAKVKDVHGAQLGRWAWDVFFVKQ